MRSPVTAALIVASTLASPVSAATSYFYVVLHPVTHVCSVVDTKPKDASTIVVIMDGAQLSRADAERGLNSMIGCANYRTRGA
jgi:hypothetical protein